MKVASGTKKCITAVLCVALIFSTVVFSASAIVYPVYGVVGKGTSTTGPVYTKAGTNGHEINHDKTSVLVETLSKGTEVKVLGTEKDGDGDTWYLVNYGTGYSKSGYIYSGRITIVANYVTDKDFEDWLTKQGFPESYKPGLRDLHSLNPNWVFYADKTGLKWADALAAESKIGMKLISKSSDASLKSMEKGAYDWAENDWIGKDGDTWVAAAERTVAYYMDPRNFFDTSSVFMFYSQKYDPLVDTPENLANMVKNNFLSGKLPEDETKTYADVIMAVGKQTGMSPLSIASIIVLEQGSKGTGKCISGTYSGYEGYYNFFNIGASPTKDMNSIQHGLWWAKGAGSNATTYSRPWNTREKAILGGAQYYYQNYIQDGQSTLYYKDYNVVNKPYYSHQYATAVHDPYSKAKSMAAGFEDVTVPLAFHIPVYEAMPAKNTLPPTGTNNNNLLKSLTVEGYKLSTFDKYTLDYDLIVPCTVSEITVKAVQYDTSAKVVISGNTSLKTGNNDVTVKVTSSSGLVRTYTITVYKEPGAADIPTPKITTTYKSDKYLTGIAPATTVTGFQKNFKVENGTITVIASSGNTKASGNIATGDSIVVKNNNGEVYKTYTVLILGDMNGDGKITSVDLLAGSRHILGFTALKGAFLQAADIDKNGKITSVDLLAGSRHILGFKSIVQ